MRTIRVRGAMSTFPDAAKPQSARPKTADYLALMDAPDQERVRADLADFFGPNADVYLDTYEKMRAKDGPRRMSFPRTWSWPVFFGAFTWFFYRKLYAYGAMLIILPLILGYLLGSSSGALSIVFAVLAKGIYVQTALGRIVMADRMGLAGAERSAYLNRAGGVSMIAGVFAGIVFVSLLALVIFAAIAELPAGG